MHDSKSLVKAVRKAGASGYVLKSRAARDLINAIKALLGGGSFFGPETGEAAPENDKPKSDKLIFYREVFLKWGFI
jgi:DNA-binding NarL/FixJ family response regulator